MINDLQCGETEFQKWILERKEFLPISEPFWSIVPVKNSADAQTTLSKIILKKHHAEVFRTIPFYKPYSKIVIL